MLEHSMVNLTKYTRGTIILHTPYKLLRKYVGRTRGRIPNCGFYPGLRMRVQENIIFHHEFILAPTVENKAKYDKMH